MRGTYKKDGPILPEDKVILMGSRTTSARCAAAVLERQGAIATASWAEVPAPQTIGGTCGTAHLVPVNDLRRHEHGELERRDVGHDAVGKYTWPFFYAVVGP